MFKKLVLFSFSICFFTFSYAQKNFGIKGAVTQSFVKESHPVMGADQTLQTGFQLGFFLDKAITQNLIFRPSLQLTQKGYHSVAGDPDGSYYSNRNLSTTYIEIPMDVIHKFSISRSSNFYVGTGPVVGYGLQGRYNSDVVFISDNQLQKYTINDDKIFKHNTSRRFEFGWDFILGVQRERLIINASYNHGITNAIKGDFSSSKNRSFALAVGYLIR